MFNFGDRVKFNLLHTKKDYLYGIVINHLLGDDQTQVQYYNDITGLFVSVFLPSTLLELVDNNIKNVTR